MSRAPGRRSHLHPPRQPLQRLQPRALSIWDRYTVIFVLPLPSAVLRVTTAVRPFPVAFLSTVTRGRVFSRSPGYAGAGS